MRGGLVIVLVLLSAVPAGAGEPLKPCVLASLGIGSPCLFLLHMESAPVPGEQNACYFIEPGKSIPNPNARAWLMRILKEGPLPRLDTWDSQ